MGSEASNDRPIRVDRYIVFDELGRGGMASVHLARLYGPVSFSRIVAFKRMLGDSMEEGRGAILLDEARLGARIRHPNVVPVLDVVRTDDELGLIMEYIHGPALAWLNRRLTSRGQPLPAPIALRIILDTLYGLHAAHEAKNERGESLQLIHRDVSPQNILIGSDGLARLADFGIAKATGKLVRTQGNQLRGKVRYMAPEQLRGSALDRRVDVFSAAIVLWEMLAQRALFDLVGENFLAIATSLLSAPIPTPSTFAPVPAPLEAVLMKALTREPDGRFATAEEFATALESSSSPASHAEVARFLTQIAADLLEKRAEMIARIEQISDVVPTQGETAPSEAAPPTTERDKDPTTDVMSNELVTDTVTMESLEPPTLERQTMPYVAPIVVTTAPAISDTTLRSFGTPEPTQAPASRSGWWLVIPIAIALFLGTFWFYARR